MARKRGEGRGGREGEGGRRGRRDGQDDGSRGDMPVDDNDYDAGVMPCCLLLPLTTQLAQSVLVDFGMKRAPVKNRYFDFTGGAPKQHNTSKSHKDENSSLQTSRGPDGLETENEAMSPKSSRKKAPSDPSRRYKGARSPRGDSKPNDKYDIFTLDFTPRELDGLSARLQPDREGAGAGAEHAGSVRVKPEVEEVTPVDLTCAVYKPSRYHRSNCKAQKVEQYSVSRPESNVEYGSEIVERVLDVFQAQDGQWRRGVITKYDWRTRKHHVVYENKEKVCLNLHEHMIRWVFVQYRPPSTNIKAVSANFVVKSRVEAQDSEGDWYRGTVVNVNVLKTEVLGGSPWLVKVNFDGWNCKWDEWISVSSGRVRPIQHPDAMDIRRDGSPVYLCSKMKIGKQIEAQDVEGCWYRATVVDRNDARQMVRAVAVDVVKCRLGGKKAEEAEWAMGRWNRRGMEGRGGEGKGKGRRRRSGRVRDMLHPDAIGITRDGKPIWKEEKRRRSEESGENAPGSPHKRACRSRQMPDSTLERRRSGGKVSEGVRGAVS
eukprot:749698-Hanusia_phi.AAC.3